MQSKPLPHDHGQEWEQQFDHMPQSGQFETVAELFKKLDDGTRLKLFWLLCHCEECVINLSAMMEMSSPAISHHLKQLKASGLISCRRDGKEVYYKATEDAQAQFLHHMIEELVEISCPLPKKED